MLLLVTSDCFILTLLVPTWITLSLYSLHSPVLALASSVLRLAITAGALPPCTQWLFVHLILWVMESPMTRVFNLSELMVGGFGVSDPVMGGGETWEGSDSDLLQLKVSIGWMSDTGLSRQHFFPEAVRKLSGCEDYAEGLTLLYSLVTQTLFHPFLHLHFPLPNDCVWSRAWNSAILTIRQ